jgi:UDP-glucose 4-epimerase
MAAASDLAGEVFNIASGVETSLNQLAEALVRAMGSDLAPEYGPERKLNAVLRRLGDTRLAKERLGFKAEIGLDEGLRRLVAWWRNRPRETDGLPSESTAR